MSGSGGVSIARTAIRGENRFYNPPPMRRMQQEAQLQQQIREKQRREEEDEMLMDKERRAAATAAMPPPRTRKGLGVVGLTETKNRVVSGSEVCGSSDSSGSGRVQSDGSNLDRFLEHTTPVVPSRFLPPIVRPFQTFLLDSLFSGSIVGNAISGCLEAEISTAYCVH